MSDVKTNPTDYTDNIYDMENKDLSANPDDTVVVESVDSEGDVEVVEEPVIVEASEEETVDLESDEENTGKIEFDAEAQNKIYDSIIKLNRDALLVKYSTALTDLSSNMTTMLVGQTVPVEVFTENVSRGIIYLEAVLRFIGINPDSLNSAIAERFDELNKEISTPEAQKEIERVNKLIEEEKATRAKEEAEKGSKDDPVVYEKDEDGNYYSTGFKLSEASTIPEFKFTFEENGLCVNVSDMKLPKK